MLEKPQDENGDVVRDYCFIASLLRRAFGLLFCTCGNDPTISHLEEEEPLRVDELSEVPSAAQNASSDAMMFYLNEGAQHLERDDGDLFRNTQVIRSEPRTIKHASDSLYNQQS